MPHTLTEKITWLDFLNPTADDIRAIQNIHEFHPVLLDELRHPSAYSKAEMYDHYLFFSYHLPIYHHETKTSTKAEIDFLITKDHVITVHYEPLTVVDEFSRQLHDDALFRAQALGEDTGKFTYYFIQKVHDFCLRQLAHIEHSVDAINEDIFSNREHLLLKEISYTKRNILSYMLIIRHQEPLMRSLREVGPEFWGEPMKVYLNDLHAGYMKVSRQIESYRDTVESLEGTNAQLLDLKTNAVVQRFTILAFLTFPLALFTALYEVPDVQAVLNAVFGNFWNSFAVMVILTLGTLLVFTNKEWF